MQWARTIIRRSRPSSRSMTAIGAIDQCDILVRNATVVDGTGSPPKAQDIAILGDEIAGLGDGSEVIHDHLIDGTGLVAAPGFIDVHTHDDWALLRTPDMRFKITQGVTTVVTGNCGISAAPFRLMEGLPEPFGIVPGLQNYSFESVDGYRRALTRSGLALNVRLLAGHSSLRTMVMGSDLGRPATAREIAQMAMILSQALNEGAAGLSSGLDYPAALSAPTEELIALARVVATHKNTVYATHVRDESDEVIEAIREALETGRRSGVPLVVSHHKCAGRANFGKSTTTLNLIDNARHESEVGLDVYPYIASSSALMERTQPTMMYYHHKSYFQLHYCMLKINMDMFTNSGSQSNFATNDFCKRLGLQTKEINFTISGVGQAMTNIKETALIKIQSCNNHFNKTILFLVLPKITEYLPAVLFSYKHLQIPSHLKLADPSFNKSAPIDMLLGSHVFWEIICVGQVQLGKGLPIMHKTLLGWVIAGNLNFKQMQSNTSISFLNIQHNNLQLDEQFTKFWQLEEVNCESPLSINDKYCESHFLENTRRDENGRFIVSIPLKTNIHNLGNSRQAALNRFFSLEKRLVKNNNLRNEYVKFMIKYEVVGHMTLIDDSYDNDKTVYDLPHHAVIKEHSSTTKVRVVFDASMKTDSGLSLNDVQCSGPTIQSDLMALILRFRVHKYVMTADICKMYRQVLINSDQRCLQRIF